MVGWLYVKVSYIRQRSPVRVRASNGVLPIKLPCPISLSNDAPTTESRYFTPLLTPCTL